MERDWDLSQVTDGKKYNSNDMVRVGCRDCEGCSACCRDMGTSLVLDPLDCFRLMKHLQIDFNQLLQRYLELNVVDGIILPNMKMPEKAACGFLNNQGRCSIHEARPGICRLFPLGRLYENNSFHYILQVHECPAGNKSKIKISKWLATPNLRENEKFIAAWHYFLKGLEKELKTSLDEQNAKTLNIYLLNQFYAKAYDYEQDFYPQFWKRMEEAEMALGL